MAELYNSTFRLHFSNSKFFTGLVYNMDYYSGDQFDITLASSIFPLFVNTLPYSWSAVDSDGHTWEIYISDVYDTNKIDTRFAISGIESKTTTLYILPGYLLPFALIPTASIYVTDNVISYADIRIRLMPLEAGQTQSGVEYTYYGFLRNGASEIASNWRYPVGTTYSDIYDKYVQDINPKILFVVDFTDSGAVRYRFKSTTYMGSDIIGGSRLFPSSAIRVRPSQMPTAISYLGSDISVSGYYLQILPTTFNYDGREHRPTVRVYDSFGNYLTEGTDYIVSLSPDLINPGTKIALAIGQGFYTGELQGNWYILEGQQDPDPYSPGGTTVPSTGPTDGTWELPADDLAVGGSPFNDLATQLYRPYAMTAAQVASFSNQLWNTDILDIISRYFEKPTEVVISLMSFPFTVECENSVQINFNWISEWSSVYVLGHPITQEIQSLDFGYVDLERYSGLFYDYQPYSSVQLYLPYIGFVPLKMNEVVGKRIRLTYLVDVLSGDFTAVVETSALGTPEPEKTLPYIGFYQGNIARPMPLSQQDLFSLFKKGTEIAITGAVAATAGTVGAIEGLAAERAVGDAVQFTEQGLPQAAQMAMGRAETSQAQSQSAYKTFKRFGAATVANSMLSIGNASAPILRNGTIDGISGRTSGQEAFIIITVPNQNVPDNQRILGYPTNQPGPLSKFSGYTEVRDIRLKIPNATESEIAEIESIVRGGIVI